MDLLFPPGQGHLLNMLFSESEIRAAYYCLWLGNLFQILFSFVFSHQDTISPAKKYSPYKLSFQRVRGEAHHF